MVDDPGSPADAIGGDEDISDESLALARMDVLIGAHRKLFDRVQSINRLWLARVQETRESEVQLGMRLLQSRNPTEASAVCNDWMLGRIANFISDNEMMTKLWFDLYAEASGVTGNRPHLPLCGDRERMIQDPSMPAMLGPGNRKA
jgi:hypothetical protein